LKLKRSRRQRRTGEGRPSPVPEKSTEQKHKTIKINPIRKGKLIINQYINSEDNQNTIEVDTINQRMINRKDN